MNQNVSAKKKKKKWLIIILLLAVVLAIGGGIFYFSQKSNKKSSENKEQTSLKGKKLDNSDDTPPFSIQFNKKDASKQEGDRTFYFDENNTNFGLFPFGEWPDDNSQEEPQQEEPQNNKKEAKVKFIKKSFLGDYVFSDNKIELIINKNHPIIKGLLNQNKLQKDKQFIIRYGKIDNKFSEKRFIFDEDNQELEFEEF